MSTRVVNLCREISGLPSGNALVVDGLKNIFKKYGTTPSVTSALLQTVGPNSKSLYKLKVKLSQIDFDSIEKRVYNTGYVVSLNSDGFVDTVTHTDCQQVGSSELCNVPSYDGKFTAIVVDAKKDGKDNLIIEFWSKTGLLKILNGEKEKTFGKIHLSFASPVWSRDGSQFMFIAEKFVSTTGYFAEEKKNDKNGDSKDAGDEDVKPTVKGNEYEIKEDWGEQLVGSCHPIVCVVDLNDDFKVRTIDVADMTCSECFWIDNKTIGFVGIKEEARRLGLIYCPIRRSCLFMCDLRDPESEPIAIFGQDFNIAVRSPRVSNNSEKIVFLSNPASGPHFQASSLMLLNVKDLKAKTLIDVGSLAINEVETPTEISTFYDDALPKRCWSLDDKKIIVTSCTGYRTHLFLVDVESGQSHNLPIQIGKAVSVLDFCDDLIVLNLTQPNIGSNLFISKLVNNQLNQLIPIDPDLSVKRDEIEFRCDKIFVNEPSHGQQLISSILIGPKDTFGKPTPTILIPHGGPHSGFVATYMPRTLKMAEAGFKVILVNYRGSTGVNAAHEKFLCGNVGTTDVSDCMLALKFYIDLKEVDKNQVCLYGGSHGGFLVTHLIGQHSDFGFRACCALNPVTDLAAGFSTSDIPDWHLVEGLGNLEPYSLTTLPSPDLLRELLLVSPIIHIDKVKTPVLMVLGTKDQRVDMCQGKAYYYGLKARGVPTKCLVYEDNHNIGKISHDLDLDMNWLLWALDKTFVSKSP